MRIAIVTFDGFNEIDSFVAAHLLNRMRKVGWSAEITAASDTVISTNGVEIRAQQQLEFAAEADAVLIGSGTATQQIVEDNSVMARLQLDPQRQLIGSQCSGALVLKRLGLIEGQPICTDSRTRPMLEEEGVRVLDQPFIAYGNVATAGGCLSSQYLASWFLWRLGGQEAVQTAFSYVASIGEEAKQIGHVAAVVEPFISE